MFRRKSIKFVGFSLYVCQSCKGAGQIFDGQEWQVCDNCGGKGHLGEGSDI